MTKGYAKTYGLMQAKARRMTRFEYDFFKYQVSQNPNFICPVCERNLRDERYEAAHIVARNQFGDQLMKRVVRCAVHKSCNDMMHDRKLRVNVSDPRFYIMYLD